MADRQTTASRSRQYLSFEASEWVIRLADPDVTRADQIAFDDWLLADPEHDAAYRRALRLYSAAGELSHECLRSAPASRWPRFLVAVSALAACLALAVIPLKRDAPPEPELAATADLATKPKFATSVAEIRTVRLPDGSNVTLGAKTAIAIDFSPGARRVRLEDGEAYFQVTHDTARPFFVEARGTILRVVGTEFEVKVSPRAVKVVVARGIVDVREPRLAGNPDLPRRVQRLTAGTSVEVAAASTRPPKVLVVNYVPAAWRDGFLTYDNAPLAEVVADANRYARAPIVLADPQLGELRVTGSYPVEALDQMMGSFETALPVSVKREKDGTIRLKRRAR